MSEHVDIDILGCATSVSVMTRYQPICMHNRRMYSIQIHMPQIQWEGHRCRWLG
uniref:Uncharacterized protein n=1 Tax=Rhizophora mucronata TaxID=61149 RepID=A0A2P2P0M9_RHIMU